MHISTVDKTNRPKTDPVMASGLVYNGQEQMLVTSMGTTYESTYKMWFREIGQNQLFYENTYLFTKATNAGEYNVEYFAGSNDYGNQSAKKTHQVTIAKSPNSGAYVTCSNYLEGTAPLPSLSGTNLSSGTITYQYSTSQNGTYTTTKPSVPGTYWVKATIAGDSNCYEYTTAATSFTINKDWSLHNSGDSADDPYVISTNAELDLFSERVNAGNSYADKYFKLGADITYNKNTANNFTPIGNIDINIDINRHPFSGHFDGNKKTISGININLPEGEKVGLFGYTNGAEIYDLTLTNSTISGKEAVGGIVGDGNTIATYNGMTISTIRNCVVTGSVNVTGTSRIGGICGEAGSVEGCRSEAKVEGNIYVGGITGYISVNQAIKNCLYTGNSITGTEACGAIVGVNNIWQGNCGDMQSNYYTADLSCKGANGYDADGARKAVEINIDYLGITVAPTGTWTHIYDVSGIYPYTESTAIQYTGGTYNKFYAGETEKVNLDITYESPYEGFSLTGYTDGNGNALTHVSGNTWKLTMPATTAYITPAGQDLWGENDGTGRDGSTAAKAYRITTPEGLNLLAKKVNGTDGYEAKTYSGKFFELGDDIVYDKTVENNYTPIGNGSNYFSGHFDGKGHTVSGINNNMRTTDYKGLFGNIHSSDGSVEVKNLTLDNSQIVGRSYCGGIAGYNFKGTISNCHVTSSVAIYGSYAWADYHGGIVGYNNQSNIIGCTSSADVTITSNESGMSNYGGIAGITDSNTSTIRDCLVYGGTISGRDYVGAIAGSTSNTPLTNNRYTAATTVNNGTAIGHGTGNNGDVTDNGGATVAYEFPGDIQGVIDALGTEGTTYGTSTYQGITAYQNGLKYNGKLYYPSLWTGSGTSDSDPYVIYTPEGLDKLASDVNDGISRYSGEYFALDRNITYDKTALTLDLDGTDGPDSNFPGIGSFIDADNQNSFAGNFDGRGHTISGIVINRPSNDCVGLFRYASGATTIKNLKLDNSTITGEKSVGAILGEGSMNTNIENCHVTSDVTVSGKDYVGGIVGMYATIQGCNSAATVSGEKYVGGILGCGNYSTVRNSLYLGNSVSSTYDSHLGAIAGSDFDATFENNYYTAYGLGGVGSSSSATGTDKAGAQFAVSSTDYQEAKFGIGDAGTAYAAGTAYEGIKPYTNGLKYNGRYYWHEAVIELADQGTTNSNVISNNSNGQTHNVVLKDRTLYKDGKWNTICLPFDVTIADSPLAGASVKKLISSDSNLTNGTLTLNFEDETTTMIAGTPYIIKWASGSNIMNPVFTNVTINKTMNDVATNDGKVVFKGNYDAQNFNAENSSILFLGAENTLYWPKSGAKIGACRAYFEITDGTSVRAFRLNFGDGEETLGISDATRLNDKGQMTNDGWYNLNGVKVEKPVRKGLYIQNGKKVVIK